MLSQTITPRRQRRSPKVPILDHLATCGRWEGECFIWTRALDRKGYGIVRYGHMVHVTRVLWTETFGSIPAGMLICHHCDNPACFRLAHLYLGTGSDNMQDMHDRNTTRYQGRDVQPHAKFTEAQAVEIRRRHAAGGVTQSGLAREYGCSRGAVWFLLHPGVAKANKRRVRLASNPPLN
mgnify:CR=1 FL=1